MPVITKISAAKKKKDRFHIYVDRGKGDEYALSVSEDLIVQQQLWKGIEIDEERINDLRDKDELDKAMQKALNYLSYRMRSEVEIGRYLKELEISEEEASSIVERLKELQFLDDAIFAQAFVRTKRDTQKKGPRLIEQELFQKGVEKKYIEEAMQQYTKELQIDYAIKMVEKKQGSYKKEAHKKKEQKLIQFLIQRGFHQETALEAVHYADVESDQDEELEAIAKQGEKAWKKYSEKDKWERVQRTKKFLYGKGFSMGLIENWLENKKNEE